MAGSDDLKYHPEAVAEILAAVRWYLKKSSGAAISFFEQLRQGEEKIRQSPDYWNLYLHDCRLYRLKRFPYGLIYQQRDSYILVVAVAHLHRKPGYWRNRLPG